ncbi:MAG: hypothetical protein LQ343_001436 [Gyalolechia ehrenbergii]|nr:MAG: hypothetical protein LQ343_001436 [Gyalolechia ehrenbergii]
MLPEQASGTNPPASTTIFAESPFNSFLSSDNSSAIEYTLDPIKTEQDDNINLGYRQIEQQPRREAQQQRNMARPGQLYTYEQDHNDETALRAAIGSALAAENAGAAPVQPSGGMEIKRPCTPPQQINIYQFPLTPDTGPQLKVDAVTNAMARSRTFDSSPIKQRGSLDACIDPSATMRRTSSYPDSKTALDAELNRILSCTSPPPSTGLEPPFSFSQFPDMSTLKMDFAAKSGQYDSSHYSPMSSALSPLMSSFESSPEIRNMSLFDNLGGYPDLLLPARATGLSSSQGSQSLSAYPSPPKEKSHGRTQSAVSVEVDGINEDTGITEDEISAYIAGPVQDNKYMCTFDNCNKLFGRKENIRSHVQTHLGDRQWRCTHCNKRFVRQHDLKRHAKIHTGQKPHLCPCGNGFARHDALTRHRQRNTCVGGFGVAEGMPQSPSKRGRPKKRPDMESRRDKAAKTRERAMEKASGSSVSGSSVYSAPSPEVFFEEPTTGSKNPDAMVVIQSQETDEVLEAVNALSPEMVEDYFREMSKGPSPFSEFGDENLFGADSNTFNMATNFDSPSQWSM